MKCDPGSCEDDGLLVCQPQKEAKYGITGETVLR